MTVYVDDMMAPLGRMKVSRMIADSTDELLQMADAIGVQRKWIKYADTPGEHFNVSKGARTKAIELGAVPVSVMELWGILGSRQPCERPTYYAWVGPDRVVDIHNLSSQRIQPTNMNSGYIVPIQIADLFRGDVVINSDEVSDILDALYHSFTPLEQYGFLSPDDGEWAMRARLLFARLTEGRE